jgi:Na+-translocating ferredoxin:NAD+ oxidoreductase RnfG subunit
MPVVVRSEVFLTEDKARQLIFPGEKLTASPITLTAEEKSKIQKASRVRVREQELRAWRSSRGGWFFLDNVIGKHEYIDIAVGLTSAGAVQGVEVLVYRETYGGEVRRPKWLAQFHGKKKEAALEVDKDIKNISGATLSSVHITEGVRRLVHTWDIALKGR